MGQDNLHCGTGMAVRIRKSSSFFYQNRVCFCIFGLTVNKSLNSNDKVPNLRKGLVPYIK